jgi:hypothetical protein
VSAHNGLVERPSIEAGGLVKAAQVFGDELTPLLAEINEVFAA